MKIGYKWAVVVATALGVAGYGAATRTSFARGGGGHGGGHEGGHHEGEHHAAHHEGEHHPYHPTEHHMANHDHHDDHHDDHHWNHHHHDWHYAGWGANPGFWGGLGLGYAAGWGWGGGGWGGGNTYIDNSGNTASDTPDSAANTAASVADDNSNDNNVAANGPEQYPVDVWPELGVSTYSGEYGQSKGLVIVRVMPHSAADRAGLVPGDVILSFNGKPTPDDEALEAILDSAKGDFNLSVWDARTGRKSVITGQLEAPISGNVEKSSG